MQNKIESKIETDRSCRFLYPNGAFVWMIGGQTADPQLESLMRNQIVRDLEKLTRLARNDNQIPVCLLTETKASSLVDALLPQFHGWGAVRFGAGELNVANADLVCALSADLILVYGEPTDDLYKLIEERDEEKNGPAPEILVRAIEHPGRVSQNVSVDVDPNARFKGDVERLRKWTPLPTRGLQIRQMIDMRPKFHLRG